MQSMALATAQRPEAIYNPEVIEMCSGLLEHNKTISSKYLYDARGSKLFDTITTLPEYYLTNAEAEILHTQIGQIAALFGDRPIAIIELGPGDGSKAALILGHCQHRSLPFRYIPVDVSESALRTAMSHLLNEVGIFDAEPVVADFTSDFLSQAQRVDERAVLLFLGSSIGNLTPSQTCAMLTQLRSRLNPGDLMVIGFDIWKGPELLLPAYDDVTGVTREFNLNLLDRFNREAGAQFRRQHFVHRPVYNRFLQCMESYLESNTNHRVWIDALQQYISFNRGERIHVEYSFKYRAEQIQELAEVTGFALQDNFYDGKRRCVISVLEAAER